MTSIQEQSDSRDQGSADALRQHHNTLSPSRAQRLLLILFLASTAAFVVMWLAWGKDGRGPSIISPAEVSLGSAQMFWLVVAAATSLASLLGMISTTIFGWRKEQREARAEALNRLRQELEIQKLQLELDRERVLAGEASKRAASARSDQTQPGQPGAGDSNPKGVAGQQIDVVPAKEPLSPAAGESRRLENQWSELDRKYRDLTRHIAALDKDMEQTLDSERRLVTQERRDELAAQREAVSIAMAELERRLVELEQAA